MFLIDVSGFQRYFIVDSGASISTIRERSVCDSQFPLLDSRDKLEILGISGTLKALGSIPLRFTVQSTEIDFEHTFHVLPSSCDLQADGILGADFLKVFDAVIDYKRAKLTLDMDDNSVTLPLHTKPMVSSYTIPPRCEQAIHVPTSENIDLVTRSLQLTDGVYVARILVRPRDGYFSCFVVNTTDVPYVLDPSRIEYDYLSDFNVCLLASAQGNVSREERLLSELKLAHLKPPELKTISDLCCEFNDVFHLPGDKLTCTNLCKQRLYLKPEATPVYKRQYRTPHAHREEITRQVTEMVDNGLAEPSNSEWNSPLLLVPKKLDSSGQKKYRIVIDYRTANSSLQKFQFQIPLITDILDRLGQCTYFSTLDLSQGYYQVELDPRDREITAFSTDSHGHLQLTRLPMGMAVSPAAFSRIMSIALSGLTQERCFVYLDDIVVFGKSLADHNVNLRKVLERLRQVNLKLQPVKCNFLQQELVYLGHTISASGVGVDKAKTRAVELYPTPTDAAAVHRFVQFVNYYRKFIKDFAKITLPLYALTKKDVPFVWTQECEDAFQMLKQSLLTAPILQYPDFQTGEFILRTDSSGFAIGAILSNHNDLPISYASRKLNKSEVAYSTIHKEFLAIVWACKVFRPYLLGRHFTIITDHRPLVFLKTFPADSSSRLTKFRLILEEYDFDIKYCPGKHNSTADALSRIEIDTPDLDNIDVEESFDMLASDNARPTVNVITRSQSRRAQQAQPSSTSPTGPLKSDQLQPSVSAPSSVLGSDQSQFTEVLRSPPEVPELRFLLTDSNLPTVKGKSMKRASSLSHEVAIFDKESHSIFLDLRNVFLPVPKSSFADVAKQGSQGLTTAPSENVVLSSTVNFENSSVNTACTTSSAPSVSINNSARSKRRTIHLSEYFDKFNVVFPRLSSSRVVHNPPSSNRRSILKGKDNTANKHSFVLNHENFPSINVNDITDNENCRTNELIYENNSSAQLQVKSSDLELARKALFAILLENNVKELVLLRSELLRLNKNESVAKKLLSKLINGSNVKILFVDGATRVTNDELKKVILSDFHNLPTAGHPGICKMLQQIKQKYYWSGMQRDILNFVNSCIFCQRNKHFANQKVPLQITTTARSSFDRIFIDTVGPLVRSDMGNVYILTIQDDLTKFIEAIAIPDKTAKTVARAMVEEFLLRYGLCKEIVTDLGTEFVNSVTAEICDLLQITHLNSTSYHHETIGGLEVSHKALGNYLRIFSGSNPGLWDTYVRYFVFVYNSTIHLSTGFSPLELVTGHKPLLPSNLQAPHGALDPLYNHESFAKEMKFKLQLAHKMARDNLLENKQKRKVRFDLRSAPKHLQVGDLVFLENEAMETKMSSLYTGPYEILDISHPNCKVLINGKQKLLHKNRLRKFLG